MTATTAMPYQAPPKTLARASIAALAAGAQVVVAGRVADPSMALAPLIHHFGWAADDWARRAAGTMVGHLLECGSQVTGGVFYDPGFKDVPDPANLGFPIAEVEASGAAVITKADGTGGLVDGRTVKEQLLYELHDPAAYVTRRLFATALDGEQVPISLLHRKDQPLDGSYLRAV